MWQASQLVLKRAFRTPLFWLCSAVVFFVAPMTLAVSAPTEQAALIIRLELAVYITTTFVAFVCALFASRTIATDRTSGRLVLLRTRPLRPFSLILGLWLGLLILANALIWIALASCFLSLKISHLRTFFLKKPDSYHIPLPTKNLRSLACFMPLSLPHLNTALGVTYRQKSPPQRILWLDGLDPRIIFTFEGDGQGVQIRGVVARALRTPVRIKVDSPTTRLQQKMEVLDEKPVFVGAPLKGCTTLTISLLAESNPVGFRLWEGESGLPETAPLLVERSAWMPAQMAALWLIMLVKASVFCAAGLLAASFLSPAVSSLLAAFLFFLFSSAHYLHTMGEEVAGRAVEGRGLVRLVSKVVAVLSKVVPASGRYQPVSLLSKGIALTPAYLGEALLYFGLCTAALLGLAVLLYLKPPHEVALLEKE